MDIEAIRSASVTVNGQNFYITGEPAQDEDEPYFGAGNAERLYNNDPIGNFDQKKSAMKQKTHNRAKGVLGPKKSRYM